MFQCDEESFAGFGMLGGGPCELLRQSFGCGLYHGNEGLLASHHALPTRAMADSLAGR